MDKEIFAERLRNALNMRGVGTLELSRRTGITGDRLGSLSMGSTTPTGFELAGIAKVLNVPSNWLAGSDDPKDNNWQKPKGSGQVIGFINDFLGYQEDAEAAHVLQSQFRSGYGYHFALLLKGLFDRGQVVWLAPYEQIGWQDDDGVIYTIGGVYQDDGEPIPVSWLGEAIKDFAHIPGEHFGASGEYVHEIIQKYHARHGRPAQEPSEALFQIGRGVYLHIQVSDDGWDYTLYDATDYHLIDGGQLDQPDFPMEEAARQIVAARGMERKVIRRAPIALLDEIQEKNEKN